MSTRPALADDALERLAAIAQIAESLGDSMSENDADPNHIDAVGLVQALTAGRMTPAQALDHPAAQL